MPKICQQPIRYIDCAVGKTDQPLSQYHSRDRGMQCAETFLQFIGAQRNVPLLVSERQRGVSQMPGYPDIVVRPGATSTQSFPFAHLADNGDTDVERTVCSIAADKCHVMGMRKSKKPV